MAERLSLDDLDEVLIEKLKGRKDEAGGIPRGVPGDGMGFRV